MRVRLRYLAFGPAGIAPDRGKIPTAWASAAFIAAAAIVHPAQADPPKVAEHFGNIEYTGEDGITRTLTAGGDYGEPSLSPDGRTVAFIHIDAKPNDNAPAGLTSLWIADGPTAKSRLLLAPRPDDDEPKQNLASFSRPTFSLDGHFVYVESTAWATSSAVHQISLETGKQHFVIDGALNAVVRTGPYRGYLIVGRHMYWPAPKVGSYNPVYIVRPDAKELFPIPGSENDDDRDVIHPWLKAHKWLAW